MALQADCELAYSTHNIYLPTAFCQTLLQGCILVIPDPDAPMVQSPLLALLSSAGPANAQERSMKVQFLLAVFQDQLSKEEAGEILYQQVHVVASNQEICHST